MKHVLEESDEEYDGKAEFTQALPGSRQGAEPDAGGADQGDRRRDDDGRERAGNAA